MWMFSSNICTPRLSAVCPTEGAPDCEKKVEPAHSLALRHRRDRAKATCPVSFLLHARPGQSLPLGSAGIVSSPSFFIHRTSGPINSSFWNSHPGLMVGTECQGKGATRWRAALGPVPWAQVPVCRAGAGGQLPAAEEPHQQRDVQV